LDCDFSKKFGKFFDQQGTFGRFSAKIAVLAHFWPFSIITSSYHQIKVPETIKNYIHMYICI
jgi:hypothetical protein